METRAVNLFISVMSKIEVSVNINYSSYKDLSFNASDAASVRKKVFQ